MSADRRGLHGVGYTELEGGGVVDHLIALNQKGDDPPPFHSSACGLVQPQGQGLTQIWKNKQTEEVFPLGFPVDEI